MFTSSNTPLYSMHFIIMHFIIQLALAQLSPLRHFYNIASPCSAISITTLYNIASPCSAISITTTRLALRNTPPPTRPDTEGGANVIHLGMKALQHREPPQYLVLIKTNHTWVHLHSLLSPFHEARWESVGPSMAPLPQTSTPQPEEHGQSGAPCFFGLVHVTNSGVYLSSEKYTPRQSLYLRTNIFEFLPE